MADPIVQQDILADSGATHQSILDRLFSTLNGAWHDLERVLPAHPSKDAVLDQLKAAYDNGAQIVKEDFEKVAGQAEDVAKTAATAAEADVKEDVPEVVSQAESEAATVAADVTADVTPTQAPASPSAPTTSSAPAASTAPAADSGTTSAS